MFKRNGKLLVLIVACLACLLNARGACAQDFSLQLGNGLVTLVARDASVPLILDRWAQISGATIVNREDMKSSLVTLQLTEVPERTALAILLRDAGGYILADRVDAGQGVSAIDRIVLFPRAPSASLPQPNSLVGLPDLTGRSVAPLQRDPSDGPQPVNALESAKDVLVVDSTEIDLGEGVPPGSPRPWVRAGESGPATEAPALQSTVTGAAGAGAQTRPGQLANPFGLGGSARPGEITTAPRRDESARPRPDPPEPRPQPDASESSLPQPDQRQ